MLFERDKCEMFCSIFSLTMTLCCDSDHISVCCEPILPVTSFVLLFLGIYWGINFSRTDVFSQLSCLSSVLTVKNEAEDETLKDEMAQQYKAMQSQQLQQPYQPAVTDAQMKKKSSRRSFKKFFGK